MPITFDVSTIFDAITASAAVAVAVIANRYSKRQTTLQVLRDLDIRMADLDDRYREIAEPLESITEEEASALAGNRKIRSILLAQLNSLETLALAVAEGIVDPGITKRLAGNFVLTNFAFFKGFMTHMRKSHNDPTAWKDFEELATKWLTSERSGRSLERTRKR